VWIALIAFALIGIVALQLLVLSLNASIGRALVREAALQRANAALGIESSEAAGGERVETRAARLGMELVPIASLRFLASDPRENVARAAAALNAPVHTASSASAVAPASSDASASGEGEASSTSTSGTASAGASAGTTSPSSESTVAPAPASASSESAAASTSPSATVTAPPASTPATTASGASTQATQASSAGGVGVAGAGEPDQRLGAG
jgi:hypothetical protein